MILKFIQLEWKSFFRSASFNANLAVKILLGFVALFYGIAILFLGVAAFYGLEELDLEPLSNVNKYLIYWAFADLGIRYFLQKTPVMGVRPLLVLPIKKNRVTHYLLGKSAFSFFNIYPALFFVPFSITLILNDYSILGVISWHLAMMSITFFNNYLNLAVNNKDGIFVAILTLVVGLGALQYFEYLDIAVYSETIFQSFYNLPWITLFVVFAAFGMYLYNYRYFYKSLYLDDAIKVKTQIADSREFTWLERFGLMGTFFKNDLRLILRNKRSRNTLWMSFFFLFYGLLIFGGDTYKDNDFMLIFASIFISGGFLFMFGGYVPSWDSSFYPFMMCQNIRYKEYLASKWWLMVIATIISMILSVFYLFLGKEFYLAILAGGVFNIGVNAHITLLSGAYVKTPIDLNSAKKPFGDKQSFNIKTMLLSLPKILLPFLIFFPVKVFYGTSAGFLAIAIVGVIGLAFRNVVFKWIERVYKEEKYATLNAYKQKN